MKTLTAEEFTDFLNGKNITKEEAIIRFVIIKTATCPKCTALINKADTVFKEIKDLVAVYTFSPKDSEISSKLSELEVAGVPVIITAFKSKDGRDKLGKIVVDYEDNFINLTNIFDAINENDQEFFGFNEFDEIIDDNDCDFMMNRVLRNIYGEVDPEIIKNRKILRDVSETCSVPKTKLL
jgi:hypothetical protein